MNPLVRWRHSDGATFFWSVTALILAKMWLTSNIRIVPLWAPHDAENYVEHARDILAGAWFGAYSDFTLIKEPFYPMYLALAHEAGLTLPLANLIVYAAACVIACLAVRPIVRNGILLSAVFAVLFYNPLTFSTLAWYAMRSLLNDSLALMAAGCALAILVRRRDSFRGLVRWWIGLGLSFAAFCLTREESIWFVPFLLVILGAYVVSIRKDPDLQLKLFGLAIPFACWSLSQAAIARLNQHVYGWNVVVETKAPEFVSAYNSMARIVSGPENLLIPVPQASREIAYRVSPLARELEPTLEGPYGHNWIKMVCAYPIHICNDYAGSFFVWAFRDAVAQAGHYTTGAEARNFYLGLANQLDRACDAGRIQCRPKARTIFPNPTLAEGPQIWANFRDGVSLTTGFGTFSLAHPDVPINLTVDDLYASVVGSISTGRQGFIGWLATDRPMQISVESSSGEKLVTYGSLRLASPDVAAALTHLGKSKWDDRDARFSFTAGCDEGCAIVATDARHHETRIPLSQESRDFSSSHVAYHLDGVQSYSNDYDSNLKDAVLSDIDIIYHSTVPWLALAIAAMLLLRGARAALRRRFTFPAAQDLLVVAAGAAGGFLILMLAALTVTYSAGFSAEYLGSFVPVMLFAVSIGLVCDGLTAYRFLHARKRTQAARGLAVRPQQAD